MPHFICTTCGTQHAGSEQPPAACTICQDERQYVKATGQQWTTLDRLRRTNRNSIRFEEPGLTGIARLEDLPNVGLASAADLRQLGIISPAELP